MGVLVTGGCGFIGSAVCRHLVTDLGIKTINLDKLTYAANRQNLRDVENSNLYHFIEGDICDGELVAKLLREHQVDAIMHLAAESHVDRSIDGPAAFIETNIVGTYTLLDAAKQYWQEELNQSDTFRFHHVSTDEVYGDLPLDDNLFTEETPYAPSSPYSASKASSDHLVRAWQRTFGLPVVLTNCSNNYGPFHFPEKLIPLVILNALEGKPLPVYGRGENVRDWLYVEDHAKALALVLREGRVGESYNIGGSAERTNLHVVETICDVLDRLRPGQTPRRSLIEFVSDRPGHDMRYAIDASKIGKELDWQPSVTFEEGLEATIQWYLENEWWWRPLREKRYAGERLGTTGVASST